MSEYPKLVRDKVPQFMRDDGFEPVTRIALPHELRILALKKLVEEAHEALEAFSQEDRLIVELADLSEAFELVIKTFRLSRARVQVVRMEKLREKGGFTKSIVLHGIKAK